MAVERTIVVTGASRGIGRAVAERLATEAHIVALARDAGRLETLARDIERSGGRCTPLAVDLRRPEAIAAALGGVEADVVVNNAGAMIKKPFVELAPDEWQQMIDVNLSALFHVTRALLPGMMTRRRGHIVNIASITGRTAYPGGVAYAATKHAVLGLSESLMLEVRDHGVRVSVVLPGSVATGMIAPGTDTSWMLKPADVAQAVADILAMPPHALVYQLEIRASQPRRG